MKISDIKPNPQNPRTIKDDNFKKLVQSIKDFPEMLDARPLVLNKDNVILGGNMRFKASKEAGLKEVPVKIVDWSEEKQREFIIKDNVSGGDWDWDILANEWELDSITEWGLEMPEWADDINEKTRSLQDSLADEELRDTMSVSLIFDKASFVEFMTYANYFKTKYGADNTTDAVFSAVKEQYESSIR